MLLGQIQRSPSPKKMCPYAYEGRRFIFQYDSIIASPFTQVKQKLPTVTICIPYNCFRTLKGRICLSRQNYGTQNMAVVTLDQLVCKV